MRDHMDQLDARLDAYLDGTLDAAARSAFEAELASSPELRSRVESQRRIDAALRRLFDPAAAPTGAAAPSAHSPALQLADAVASHPAGLELGRPSAHFAASAPRQRPWGRIIGIAAALLLVGAGVAMYFGPSGPPGGASSGRTADAVYRLEVDNKAFQPRVVCTTDEQFKTWTAQRLGEPLRLTADATITLVGWDYEPTAMSPSTAILLAKVNGDPVLVLMDRAANDHGIKSRTPDVHVFRGTVGGVVLYEVTPAAQPSLISRFATVPR